MKYISCMLFSVMLSSCTADVIFHPKEVLKIPNSSLVIHTYSKCGNFVTSSCFYGKLLLDSTEVLTSENAKETLPGYIYNVDTHSNLIETIIFKYEINETNKGIKESDYKGFLLREKIYYVERGKNVGLFYSYSDIKETNDSIFFENVRVQGFGVKLPLNIGFTKGIVTEWNDNDGKVERYELTLINTFPLWEGIINEDIRVSGTDYQIEFEPFYKGHHFNGENQIHLKPLSNVNLFDISFYPDSLAKDKKFSNEAVYKDIRFRTDATN